MAAKMKQEQQLNLLGCVVMLLGLIPLTAFLLYGLYEGALGNLLRVIALALPILIVLGIWIVTYNLIRIHH